ncbi:MAG: phospholipase D family protein [Jannaschia sp.]
MEGVSGAEIVSQEDGSRSLDVLITAEEAYPAFERLILSATSEISAGFRIFDFKTRLRSEEGRAIGEDWFDLILHALRRGVSFRLVLSDFDPVVGAKLHGLTWRSMRYAAALKEAAGPDARVDVSAALHPAKLAWPARLALWPRVQSMLKDRVKSLAEMPERKRERYLQEHPSLARMLHDRGDVPRPIRFVLPSLSPVTHHQKVAVIDRRVVYCGGLDLNERRYDTKHHEQPAEETWHDVQVILRNEAAAVAAHRHLEDFVAVTQRDRSPAKASGGVLRTLSMKAEGGFRLFAPRRLLTELETEILRGISEARRLIYIETQFLRDLRVARALATAARKRPELELFLVLPGAPEDVAFLDSDRSDARFGEFQQARAIRTVRRAFRQRAFVGAPARRVAYESEGRDSLHGAPLIYVHAKVCLFDDRAGIVSSANLNGRSLRWDTEFGTPLQASDGIADLRRRFLEHWAGPGDDGSDGALDAETCVAAWRGRAARNVRLAPEARAGFLLPYQMEPAKRFGRDLPGIPEEMV